MNERIKKLGLEAADWLDDQESVNTAHAMQLYQKKFAELIVRECAELCKNNLIADDTKHDLTYNDGVMDCAIMLKQHFGVE